MGSPRKLFSHLSFDGTNHLLVWQDQRNYSPWDNFAARISPEGTVLDPDGILFGPDTAMPDTAMPDAGMPDINVADINVADINVADTDSPKDMTRDNGLPDISDPFKDQGEAADQNMPPDMENQQEFLDGAMQGDSSDGGDKQGCDCHMNDQSPTGLILFFALLAFIQLTRKTWQRCFFIFGVIFVSILSCTDSAEPQQFSRMCETGPCVCQMFSCESVTPAPDGSASDGADANLSDFFVGDQGVESTAPQEICDNKTDDDGDCRVDCADPDCEGNLACEICGDKLDNNGNGLVDCNDEAACDPCGTETQCNDGKDNDFDGKYDCTDDDCYGRAAICPTDFVEICDNGINDTWMDRLNPQIDCADSYCQNFPYLCEEPDCDLYPTCREEICDNGIDDDFDFKPDCLDEECGGYCKEICDDDTDNDFDGYVDCEDSDCTGDLACQCGT